MKTALIGAGYLGRHHARILSKMPNISLEVIVDKDINRARDAASGCSAIAMSDYREALSKAEVFCIATTTESHFQIALDCIKNNKHLFIEKPITNTSEQARILIDESEKQGVFIQVGHIERFNPAFLRAREILTKPVLFESERLSPFIERAAGIDVVKDLMIHDIDLILSLLRHRGIDSSVKEIRAKGVSTVTNKTDHAAAWIEFACGISAALKASRISNEKTRQMTIYEDKGYVNIDYNKQRIVSYSGSDNRFLEEELLSKEELLFTELKSFFHSISAGNPPKVTASEAMEALALAEKINKIIDGSVQDIGGSN